MSDHDDARPGAKVIPLAGRVPRRGPRPARPAPPVEREDDSDASLLAGLEAQRLDEAIVAAEREIARGDADEVDTLAELRNKRALRSFLRGDHGAAFAEWQAIIDEDPRRSRALSLRRMHLEQIGDLAGARADLDHLVRLWPKSAEVYASRALFFSCHGDLARARADYERAANLAPGDHEICVRMAGTLIQTFDHAGAIRALGRAIKLAPWRADLYKDRATQFQVSGHHDDALRDLTRCLELDPKNLSALLQRAGLHPWVEGVDLRLADLTRALAIESDCWQTLYRRALCYQQRGEHDRAAGDLTRAIALFFERSSEGYDYDQDAALHAARAEAHMGLAAYDEAVEDLKRVRRMEQGQVVETHLLLAEAHRKRGDLASAAAAYCDAWRRDESQLRALRERMEENRDAGRTEAQREDLEILLLVNPADSDALSERARLFSAADAPAEAMADLDRALDGAQAGYRHDLFHQRAGVRWALDDFAGAIEDESRALSILPCEATYLAWRGFRRGLAEGPSAAAEADVDLAVELAPDDLTAHYLRGEYLVLARRRQEALRAFTRRIELAPDLGILYFQRGEARLELGQGRAWRRRALADFDAAIERGHDDPEALEARAGLAASLGVTEAANEKGTPRTRTGSLPSTNG